MAYLFYVFTATQLINIVNLKCSYFNNIPSDIYIQTVNRIPSELIMDVYILNIFDRLYVDNRLITTNSDIIYSEKKGKRENKIKKPLRKLPMSIKKVGGLFLYYIYKKKLMSIIRKRHDEVQYERIFLSTCGASSTPIIKEIKKKKEDVHISIVEEGTVNYQWNVSKICQEVIYLKHNDPVYWTNKLLGITKSFLISLIEVVDEIYLYSPTSYPFDDAVTLKKLPLITSENPAMSLLQSGQSMEILDEYSKRYCCYLLQDATPQLEKIIQSIVTCIDPRKTIFREHPWYPVLKGLNDNSYLEDIYVDSSSNNMPFESLLADIDTENFILITTDSSATLTPKYMFDKEPYIVYLYRITQNRSESDIKNRDTLVQNLERLYQDKERIFVPNTLEEFIYILDGISKKMKDNRTCI